MSEKCGKYSLAGEIVNKTSGQITHKYVRLDCKTYACTYCGEKKVKRIKRAMIKQAINFKLHRLLTLTLNPRNCTEDESIEYIRYCWGKFRTYLMRQCGGAITFIAVIELQKSGYAHLHILVDRFISQSWVSEAWYSLGGGKIVDIRYIDIHRIAGYLTKYLTKEMMFNLPKGVKRYTTSRNIMFFDKVKKESHDKWEFLRVSIFVLYDLAGLSSCDIQYDDRGCLKAFVTDFGLFSDN